MKKSKRTNKGFTLTELIIVIVVIGILAAVLIPSITGYVDKARRSNDEQLAGDMSNEVQNYCAKYGISQKDLLGTDVRTILLYRGFDLKPNKNKWTFVYNIDSMKVEVKDVDNDNIVFADTPTEPLDPTHIENNYFLVGKGNSNLEKAVDLMCNLNKEADYTEVLSLIPSEYRSVMEKFNPHTTLFINSGGVFSTASDISTIVRIVSLEYVTHVPALIGISNNNAGFASLQANIKLPQILQTMTSGTVLAQLFPKSKVVDLQKIEKIDMDQFGNDIETGLYKFKLGKYVVNSKLQVFSDELISYSLDTNTNKYMVKRCFTVNYFDETGLFASGSIVYASLEAIA